jgi:hypothetical protein
VKALLPTASIRTSIFEAIQKARDRVRIVEGTRIRHPPEFKNPPKAVRSGNLAAQDLDITDAVTVVPATSSAEPDARLPEVTGSGARGR